MIRLGLYWLILLMTFQHSLQAEVIWESGAQENFSVKILLSSSDLHVTDRLKVTIDLMYPNTYKPSLDLLRMNLLKFSGEIISPFSVSSETIDLPKEISSGVLLQHISLELEPMMLGKHYLTFKQIAFQPQQQDLKEFQIITPVFEVNVTLPPEETTEMNFAAPLMTLSKTIPVEISEQNQEMENNPAVVKREGLYNESTMQARAFPWAALAFAFLCGSIYLIVKTKPHEVPVSPEPAMKAAKRAQVQALNAMDELSRESLIQEKHFDAFYTKLTNIVRKFIENRYQLRASTYTTQEFLEHVSKHPVLEKKARAKLIQFLDSADKVKFAQYEPTIKECEQAKHDAHEFVHS